MRSLVKCMAATAGCGVMLNKQHKRVRLHSLLPVVWVLEVVISLTLMRYVFTVQMQFNQCQWQLCFLSSFNGWMYGWNGRVWCDRKRTGRTLTLIVLIVACCVSAWSYNLAAPLSCAILVSKYNTINGNDDSALMFVGWFVECMERISCWSTLHEQRVVRLCL